MTMRHFGLEMKNIGLENIGDILLLISFVHLVYQIYMQKEVYFG